ERGGVRADLALVDEAAAMRVDELDGVLEGDDVGGALAVDQVDEGGQGGRLAGARRAGDEDEAAGLPGQAGDDRRQAELVEGGDLGEDAAHGEADGAALDRGVAPEPGRPGTAKAKSSSRRSAKRARWSSVMTLAARAAMAGPATGAAPIGTSRPSTRRWGGASATRCRSEAPRAASVASRSARAA